MEADSFSLNLNTKKIHSYLLFLRKWQEIENLLFSVGLSDAAQRGIGNAKV